MRKGSADYNNWDRTGQHRTGQDRIGHLSIYAPSDGLLGRRYSTVQVYYGMTAFKDKKRGSGNDECVSAVSWSTTTLTCSESLEIKCSGLREGRPGRQGGKGTALLPSEYILYISRRCFPVRVVRSASYQVPQSSSPPALLLWTLTCRMAQVVLLTFRMADLSLLGT